MDDNTLRAITLLINLLTPLGLGYLAVLTVRANTAAAKANRNAVEASDHARQEVHVVRATLAETNDATTGKLNEIHTLVNSRLTEALAKIDRLEERLYHVTGELPTGEPPPTPPSNTSTGRAKS